MNKLKKYFIPHRGNDFRPHFFRTKAVLLTASLIGVLFLFATALGTIVVKNSSQMFGAVISSVLVDLANTDRSASKLQGLTVNPVLVAAAQLKADDMAAKGYFAHTSPEGKTPWYWFKQAGYSYSFAGENLAVYFSDSAELEKAWMDSPTHRANILNSSYTEIGIAMAHGKYQGVDTVYVVQEFGRPRKSVALPSIAKTEIASPVKIALAETLPKKAEPKETPIVKGAEAETLPKILKEESTFIEVENIEDTATATLAVAKTVTEKPKTTEVLKIVASPKTFLKTVYSWIALFVAFALVIMIGVEIKRQHPRHIAYGVSLLILMGLLLYFWQSVFGSLLVV
jgi:uncharacterized protein YkwD